MQLKVSVKAILLTPVPTHWWTLQCFLIKHIHQNHQESILKTYKSEVLARRFLFNSSGMSTSLYLLGSLPT